MDSSTLRWILVILGVLVLAGVFLFGNPDRRPSARGKRRSRRVRQKKRGGQAARREADSSSRREPTLAADSGASRFEDENSRLEPGLEPGDDPRGPEARQGELGIGARSQETERQPEPLPGPPPDKTITLYLQARDNRSIAGAELLAVALKSGMVFGVMDIFHRMTPGDERPVFSLANLTKPGWFDKNAWNTMETKGVTLFMALPGPLGALDAWDSMLATARRIAEVLHMDLLDSEREVFTREREGQIREELREYERAQRPEG